jgi:peptidoglycan biosynthesis protein MviN/MurJ (putative lipid II flippase)
MNAESNADSHHRRIAIGCIWVSLFVLVGKLAGAAKEMAIAWRYGVSGKVDAYVFIFNLVNWPVAVWFSVLTVVLVPLVARLKREQPAALPRFAGELLGLSLAVGCALAILSSLSVYWMGMHGSGLEGPAAAEAVRMVPPLSALLPLGLFISVISAWTMALGQHRNTLLEAVPSLVLLCILVLPQDVVPDALVWGSVAGCTLHATSLAWPLWRSGAIGAPVLSFSSAGWRYFWGGIGIMVLGQAFASLTAIVDQFFAATLGEGAVSVLSYANRLMTLILGLGAMAISRATLPVFSELGGDHGAAVHAMARRWASIMFGAGAAGFALAWILAPWGVKLLFERGAFGADDTTAVVSAFRYLGLQVPFYFASLVLIAYFSSVGKYKVVAVSGVANMAVKAVLLYLLAPVYGLRGVCLSTVVMYAISLGLFVFLFMQGRPSRAQASV